MVIGQSTANQNGCFNFTLNPFVWFNTSFLCPTLNKFPKGNRLLKPLN